MRAMSEDFTEKIRRYIQQTFTGKWFRTLIYQRLFVILLILLQIVTYIVLSVWVSRLSVALNTAMRLFSWIVVFIILAGNKVDAYKLSWIVIVLAFPLVGGGMYAILYLNVFARRLKKKLKNALQVIAPIRRSRPSLYRGLGKQHDGQRALANYINNTSGYPLYQGGQARYLAQGEEMFEDMLREMGKAEKYIFLEFFIVENGSMLDRTLEVLTQRAMAGVEVCFLYDDMGSLLRLPQNFPEILGAVGINCRRFNHLTPVLSTQFNNRDHRKICVIDGKTAYTGGINLADEYINEKERFGHWKDSGIVFNGEAAWGLALMFLELWSAMGDGTKITQEDVESYCPDPAYLEEEVVSEEGQVLEEATLAKAAASTDSLGATEGYIQPFGDTPFDTLYMGRTVYNKLIYYADRYLYITTPYLVIDEEMVQSICQAAQSGVDVRIITPHIWDKAYVRVVSRSYYEKFILAGVKIYEYTPGFIHSKTLVTDDETCVVGTINFDFRSLYLHFEDAIVVYNQPCVSEVKEDFLKTLAQSQRILLEDCKLSLPKKLFAQFLRLFAPLM